MTVGFAHDNYSSALEAVAMEPPAVHGAVRPEAVRIMIVDDEPINIKVVSKFLERAGYRRFTTTTKPSEAAELARREPPDVILLDIMMPEVSGLDLLRRFRTSDLHAHTPIIILTASNDEQTKLQALELGATDFLGKPVDFVDLLPRVRNALVAKDHQDRLQRHAELLAREVAERTCELVRTRLEVIHCLARASEYRDNETGRHVIRVGRYVGITARALGVPEPIAALMEQSAPLHDVGKIGISDSILLKPGKLTPDEFEIMQTHALMGRKLFEPLTSSEFSLFREHADIGSRILDGPSSPLLQMAARIALTHHERWDGSGYPLALAGEAIPLEGRITAVADVFDALSSRRPYKPAFPLEKCLTIMREERGKHFDPVVLDAFLTCEESIVAVQIEYADVA